MKSTTAFFIACILSAVPFELYANDVENENTVFMNTLHIIEKADQADSAFSELTYLRTAIEDLEFITRKYDATNLAVQIASGGNIGEINLLDLKRRRDNIKILADEEVLSCVDEVSVTCVNEYFSTIVNATMLSSYFGFLVDELVLQKLEVGRYLNNDSMKYFLVGLAYMRDRYSDSDSYGGYFNIDLMLELAAVSKHLGVYESFLYHFERLPAPVQIKFHIHTSSLSLEEGDVETFEHHILSALVITERNIESGLERSAIDIFSDLSLFCGIGGFAECFERINEIYEKISGDLDKYMNHTTIYPTIEFFENMALGYLRLGEEEISKEYVEAIAGVEFPFRASSLFDLYLKISKHYLVNGRGGEYAENIRKAKEFKSELFPNEVVYYHARLARYSRDIYEQGFESEAFELINYVESSLESYKDNMTPVDIVDSYHELARSYYYMGDNDESIDILNYLEGYMHEVDNSMPGLELRSMVQQIDVEDVYKEGVEIIQSQKEIDIVAANFMKERVAALLSSLGRHDLALKVTMLIESYYFPSSLSGSLSNIIINMKEEEGSTVQTR